MAKYPVIRAGLTITTSLLTDMQPDVIVKASQQNAADTTTLANDDELFASLAANAQYRVELHLIHSSHTSEDFKGDFSLPSGASAAWGVQGAAEIATSNTAAEEMNLQGRVSGEDFQFGGGNQVATTAHIQGEVTTGGTAGTLQFRFAKVTASGLGTTAVRAGSTMIVRRVA